MPATRLERADAECGLTRVAWRKLADRGHVGRAEDHARRSDVLLQVLNRGRARDRHYLPRAGQKPRQHRLLQTHTAAASQFCQTRRRWSGAHLAYVTEAQRT